MCLKTRLVVKEKFQYSIYFYWNLDKRIHFCAFTPNDKYNL